jgi:hypothetical protein
MLKIIKTGITLCLEIAFKRFEVSTTLILIVLVMWDVMLCNK